MTGKRIAAIILATALFICALPMFASAATPHFDMDKLSYIKGETMKFTFQNTDSSMYICILKAGYKNYTMASQGGDRVAVACYCGSSTGSYSTANIAEGSYAAVLFGPSWAKYNEYTFTVDPDPAAPNMSIAQTVYTKGDIITFNCANVSSSYNVSILHEGYSNYTMESSGGDRVTSVICNTSSPTFNTSSMKPGKYSAVLFKEGWVKYKEVFFELKDPSNPKSFTIDKNEYAWGDTLHYTFKNAVSGDYVVIFPAPVKDYNTRYGLHYLKAKELTYDYEIPTSLPVGDYSARFFDNAGNWSYIGEQTFSVKAAAPKKTVSMESVNIGTGKAFTVNAKNYVSGDKVAIRAAGSSTALQTKDAAATVNFTGLAAGSYKAVLYEGGNTSAVKSEVAFTVSDYYNSGDTIEFFLAKKVDLSKEAHTDKPGKLFIGWEKSSGGAATNNTTFAAGTKLVAKYIDFDRSVGGDFSVYGVQMRATGVQGLRFIVEKSNALEKALPNGSAQFGTLVIPSVILNDNAGDRYTTLTYGRTYTYSSKSYTPSAVVGENLFETRPDRVLYTACVTNLTSDKYRRQYTARGYIKFKDLNGIDQIAYSDEYSTNLYVVTKATNEAPYYTEAERKILNGVIDTVDADLNKQFDVSKKTTVLGSPSNKPKWVYKLNDTGVQVREVDIDSGKGGDAVTVVQLTDLHLTPSSSQTVINTVRRTMDYAASADMLVVDGDAIDKYSEKAIDMLYKEVWNVNPSAFIALGNHDFVDGTGTGMSNTKVYEALQAGWKHDIYYSSKVIDGKVMVIQLDDGATTFRECQVAPLKADLKTAKENGYVVLIFTHVSLCTCNPAETAVNSLDGTADTKLYPFGTNSNNTFLGAPSMAAGATKDVYELIVNNADVVKGVFTGHAHKDFYTEIIGKTSAGKDAIIPQYTLAKSTDNNGHVLKITVK